MKRQNDKTPRLLADLFFSFAKISLLTVGGGPAMIPLVVDLATERRGWLTKEEMMDCLTIAQSLPGGVIVNMATYIGRRLCGTIGMLIAAFGVVFPSAVLAVIVGVLLGNLGDNMYVTGALTGAKAAAAGLVLATFFKLGAANLRSGLSWIIALCAMAAIVIFHVSAIFVIIAGGLLGLILAKVGERRGG